MTDYTKYLTSKNSSTRFVISGRRKCECGYEEYKKERASRRRRLAARGNGGRRGRTRKGD
ncbi:MAG: hypothetical protein CMK23_05800 [Porticoccaceae bacterium]|nr:hypothetical protein [Porticoccaceae bacterium]